MATLTLTGASGTKYEFTIHDFGPDFNAVGAVYAITKRYQKQDGNYTHSVIYIGQTEDLSTRFDNHHKEDCFTANGANCTCIHRDDDEQSRLDKESDLVEAYKPPCNG